MSPTDIKVYAKYRDKKGRVRRIVGINHLGEDGLPCGSSDVFWSPISGFAKSCTGGVLYMYNFLRVVVSEES